VKWLVVDEIAMTDDTIFWALVAVTVAMFTWGIAQVLVGLVQAPADKLEERLRADLKMRNSDRSSRSPIQRQARELPPLIAGSALLRTMDKHLEQAFPGVNRAAFVGVILLVGAGASIGATMVHSIVAGGVAAAVTIMMPIIVIEVRRSRRQRILNDQLIDALDFLSRILRAGHSLSTGFQMMGDELPEPIAAEFRRCYGQHSLGQSLEQAMLEMAVRVDSTDFAFFVTSVIIQRQTGGDLAELLDNISDVVRKRIRLQQHVKVLTAEGRLTGWLLTALPPAVLVVLYLRNPSYEGILLFTHGGRMLLLGMLGLQLIGLFLIRRIVTVKV
jgi:tight adherence protein B